MFNRVYQIVGRPRVQADRILGHLSLPAMKVGQSLLAQLLLLAATVLSYSVVAMAVANSLFISHVGAGNLPLAFIAIGLFSIPAYGTFSLAVDRYSRPTLFRYALSIFAAAAFGLWFLLTLDATWIYYVLLIFIFFQWDFHNNILYPSLLTDYFTTLEYKRYAPFIGIAQAAGTLLGGGLTILLSRYITTRDLLLALILLLAIAFCQLLYLESSQRQLDVVREKKSAGLIESLKTFPDLVKGYPLVLLLASSSFLLVIIYVSSEFLWLNIYGRNFDEQSLTGFLGLMRIVISSIQVAVLYGATRPLLQWLGVARLNAVYPFTTLLSFLGLLLNLNLPAAIGLHVNGDALYKAINLPVHQLNYNAIPQEFIGRVRAVSDGMIYSIGLTLAGIVLWFAHLYLSLEQITWLAASLTILLLLVRLPMGKYYARSLEKIIRSDSINLDDFGEEGIQLPPQSASTIREFVTSGDRYLQIKGLELASSLGQPSQFFNEILALLPGADARLRRAVLKLFTNSDGSLQPWEPLTNDRCPAVRATALEILIVNRYTFSESQLLQLLADENPEIKTTAAIATASSPKKNARLVAIAESIWQSELPQAAIKAAIRVIAHRDDRDSIALLQQILPKTTDATKSEALEALTQLALPGELELARIAVAQLQDPTPEVRVAAYQLLEATRCEAMLSYLKQGLADSDPAVRQQATLTLAAYGQSGLTLAAERLTATNPEVVKAAIATIGRIRTKNASDILFKHLAPEFEQLTLTRKWQQRLPENDLNWKLLAVAIDDYHQRLIQKVLYILSCLGYSRTVNSVTRILATTDTKKVANAIEVLASISERRFIAPLIPILESRGKPPQNSVYPSHQWLRTKGYKILLEALESKDRWIRTGALIPLATIPSALIGDRDPVVRLVAREIFPTHHKHLSHTHVAIAPTGGELRLVTSPLIELDSVREIPPCGDAVASNFVNVPLPPSNTSMNRLLLLKNIAPFKNLSLDELFAIDKELETERVLAGETIYTEGSWGTHLYIIADGRVRLVKQLDDKQQEIDRLAAEEYFGEIALFDDAPRWDGAMAITNCTLLKLEKKRFISLISQRPHIILEICRFLSKRVRETDKYLSPTSTQTPQLQPEASVDS